MTTETTEHKTDSIDTVISTTTAVKTATEQVSQTAISTSLKQSFDVTGMTCAACSARVEKTTNKVEGVRCATVNLLKNSMEVEFDRDADIGQVTQAIEIAVNKAGYGAVPKVGNDGNDGSVQGGGNLSVTSHGSKVNY